MGRAASERCAWERRSAFAAEGQASRASPQPRASTSCFAPEPTTRAVLVAFAAAIGGRLSSTDVGSPVAASNCCTNNSPCPPTTATATAPCDAALAAIRPSEDIPLSSASQPIARPCAAAMATRMPVKLPGPTPTRIRAARRPSITSAIIGTSRSAWPRPISSSRPATQLLASSNKATVHAALEVSKARIISGGIVGTCGSTPQPPQKLGRKLDGFDRLNFRNVMPDQALDSPLQRYSGRGAARAGAVHRKIEVAVLVTLVDDVATVLGDRRTHAGLDQLLDLVDDVGVLRVLLEVRFRRDIDARGAAGREQRRTAHKMVEQRFEHQRFEVGPGNARRCGHR